MNVKLIHCIFFPYLVVTYLTNTCLELKKGVVLLSRLVSGEEHKMFLCTHFSFKPHELEQHLFSSTLFKDFDRKRLWPRY